MRFTILSCVYMSFCASAAKWLSASTTACDPSPSSCALNLRNETLTAANLNKLIVCMREAGPSCFVMGRIEQVSEEFDGNLATVLPFDLSEVDLSMLPKDHRSYLISVGLDQAGYGIEECQPSHGILNEEGKCSPITAATSTLEGLLTKLCLFHECLAAPARAQSVIILTAWGPEAITTTEADSLDHGRASGGGPLLIHSVFLLVLMMIVGGVLL
eukprot:Protomagalhaensia_wolfi_Nauph_80__1343@NODE_17_length_4969_cov_77_430426_g13_i0_p3_GENE_NODE_17_length_4969_cov_77_430426_g13_i0NODE_17_length_4969_cov_77_430426_g13_i0_p3_ORF_typecomplete_len215_score25_92_NODE_17_length_4969_cov_77_430426_g13_i038424486